MRRLSNFAACRNGMAATEFALVLPVMTLLFFGMLEASELLTVKRRVANAANSLVDLVSQEPAIKIADVNDAIAGSRQLLEPTVLSAFSARIVSLVKGPNPDDPVTVHWSVDSEGGVPYAAGQVYDKLGDNLSVRNEASVILVEMDYEYASGLVGRVFSNPFDFTQAAVRWPRKSSRVQLCQTSDPATCTN